MLYAKLVWMYLTAMFTAIFIYPVLHELGHFLAAIVVGADIVNLSVFPSPYLSLLLDNPEPAKQVTIGMFGMMFPVMLGMIKPNKLTSSTVVYTVRLVNIFAWLLSCIAIVMNHLGSCWENEDIITVIRSVGGGETAIFIFCVGVFGFCLFVFFKEKPARRMISFF